MMTQWTFPGVARPKKGLKQLIFNVGKSVQVLNAGLDFDQPVFSVVWFQSVVPQLVFREDMPAATQP